MISEKLIDTAGYSERLRSRAIDLPGQRILVSRIADSAQESDLSTPTNCGGYGRLRHFRRRTSEGWPSNPLPIDPASRALGLPIPDEMEAQVFQNAACNWRCWYCYVPFALLAANEKLAAWFSADELVELYSTLADRPKILDLTGGQPDLTPEWVPWTMEALRRRGLESSTYLWSDDNLSNDYHSRYLTESTRRHMSEYPMYGRVCCFKGFDAESFSYNTRAEPESFARQFELFSSLLAEGLDLFAYVTFTAPSPESIRSGIPKFVDRLQQIHPNLPLRTVPLEIVEFAPVSPRLNAQHRAATENQWIACDVWQEEIDKRYTADERRVNIVDVPMRATES